MKQGCGGGMESPSCPTTSPTSSTSTVTLRRSEDKNRKVAMEGNENVLNKSPGVSSAQIRFQQLLTGLDAPGDSGNPPVPPPWLDKDLFNKGRQFYQRYFFCVFISDLVALIMLFTVSRILRPLIYTGRSDTPFKALRRYVSTISHVMTWYGGDMWDPADPAHQDILEVRRIHLVAAKTFNASLHRGKVDSITTTTSTNNCPFYHHVKQDLKGKVGPKVELEDHPNLYISQWDQMFTQYSFLGVMVAHPWKMGAWWVTEGEMEGFIHFWRGVGWLLGIEDQYNFCNGSLEETRALCNEMERCIVKPSLSEAGNDHEIMGRSLIEGLSSVLPFFSYPAILKLVGDVLNLSLPSVTANMCWKDKLQYVLLRVVLNGVFVVPGVARVFGEVLQAGLRAVSGQNPRWRPKIIVTPYSY